ncbi:MAG TPA: carboxylating nicotinate-nucleotide diphosphorylase [Gemmatimonadales bacterium]
MAEPLGQSDVRRALAEDLASGDITTRLLGAAATRAAALRFVAEAKFVVAGLPVVELTFRELDPHAQLETHVADGSWAESGVTVATVRAQARALLSGERVALNFLQRLSGIATLTRRVVDAVAGTGAQITHTRKTTPGLRALEVYAVRMGGGVDNRASLADAVLWKDNHWVLLEGTLTDALKSAPPGVPVIVEVENDVQLAAALSAGVTHILVDNQTPEKLAAWAQTAGPRVTIQASGGITAETARAYAEAGANLIAIGALTHSAPAAAIRCELD